MNISGIINKKISSDPAFKQSTKNLIEAFYNTSYADLVIYTNGCMLDPDLKNFDKYNPNQEKFDDFAYRFGQIQDTSRDLMGYTNTAYKALKADSVGTGSFKFDARQALQAIQRSEGSKFVKEYFRIGGYKTFKANVKSGKALNKIYIQSSKNRQRICFRMAYKYGTTTQVMSASVKSNGISWYEGPNCKDPYVDQADKGFK